MKDLVGVNEYIRCFSQMRWGAERFVFAFVLLQWGGDRKPRHFCGVTAPVLERGAGEVSSWWPKQSHLSLYCWLSACWLPCIHTLSFNPHDNTILFLQMTKQPQGGYVIWAEVYTLVRGRVHIQAASSKAHSLSQSDTPWSRIKFIHNAALSFMQLNTISKFYILSVITCITHT